MPGLIDAHAHLISHPPTPLAGAEPTRDGVGAHFLARSLRAMLRMGITTVRNVGGYGDEVAVVRQAQRYGAFRGPRILTCGRILSATSPGGRFFDGMYREADGTDELRKAVREQFRDGADFIKVMTTGARSVEIEDPEPAQLRRDEVQAIVDEAHRMGYRVAAHCEGIDGTAIAIETGIDTIEHGMYLHTRPDLLERMATTGQILVPTFGCYYGLLRLGGRVGRDGVDLFADHPAAAGSWSPTWTPCLVDLAEHNLVAAERTLQAARAHGVQLAMGFDWSPLELAAIEIVRMAHHGLTTAEALQAATIGAAGALGLTGVVGDLAVGQRADLLIVDGDPLTDPTLLLDPARIALVIQGGEAVAGAWLECDLDVRGHA